MSNAISHGKGQRVRNPNLNTTGVSVSSDDCIFRDVVGSCKNKMKRNLGITSGSCNILIASGACPKGYSPS